jgi:hypothetical protein
MFSERVSVLDGKDSNILVVAPHGPDDKYTIEMAHALHEMIDCHVVINNCFKRADTVDSINDLANCNNTDHCIQDAVIFEEFTKPIIRLVNKNYNKFKSKKFFIFWLHGMDYHNNVDCVFGYGLGLKSDRKTMLPWRVACIYESLSIGFSYKCAVGKAGGKYAARSKDNMTQLFKAPLLALGHGSHLVEAVQIEYSSTIRSNVNNAVTAAINLGQILPIVAKAEIYHPQLPPPVLI